MQISLLEYLENANKSRPNQIVYIDEQETITISEMYTRSRQLATLLCAKVAPKSPVFVLAEKSVMTPVLYHAILFAGCHYIPLGADLPRNRLNTIMDAVNAKVLLVDGKTDELLADLNFEGIVVSANDCNEYVLIDEHELDIRRKSTLDIDPAYILFTSGTSGKPKGIVTSHRSVIDYIDVVSKTFAITDRDTLGSQAPFDYIAAIRDIYLPLAVGARTVLIPKSLFSMPAKLFAYVNEKEITTLFWVSSALSLCCELRAMGTVSLARIEKVIFTGSALPCKHLRLWQDALPGATFINHYGPTEITASCTYYVVPGRVSDEDTLPIGVPFANTDILLLDENGSLVPPGEVGEICVRGAGLALGYYNDIEKTDESFIQNPLQAVYTEPIYKTGDLGSLMPDGNYLFHGRKDSQIKHMGHRIELSEIEAMANTFGQIQSCCCLYKQDKGQIWLFYTASDCDNGEIAKYLRERLPAYMVPRKFIKLSAFPLAFNGKLDVQALREMM